MIDDLNPSIAQPCARKGAGGLLVVALVLSLGLVLALVLVPVLVPVLVLK